MVAGDTLRALGGNRSNTFKAGFKQCCSTGGADKKGLEKNLKGKKEVLCGESCEVNGSN